VETYPAVKEDFGNVPVLSFPTITTGFTESMPKVAGLDAEATVDVWLNNFGIEIMIWVDNHGQTPAGNILHLRAQPQRDQRADEHPGVRPVADAATLRAGPVDPQAGRLRMGDRLHRRPPTGLRGDQLLGAHINKPPSIT
jgi:hypothetical protein